MIPKTDLREGDLWWNSLTKKKPMPILIAEIKKVSIATPKYPSGWALPNVQVFRQTSKAKSQNKIPQSRFGFSGYIGKWVSLFLSLKASKSVSTIQWLFLMRQKVPTDVLLSAYKFSSVFWVQVSMSWIAVLDWSTPLTMTRSIAAKFSVSRCFPVWRMFSRFRSISEAIESFRLSSMVDWFCLPSSFALLRSCILERRASISGSKNIPVTGSKDSVVLDADPNNDFKNLTID